MFRLFYAPFRLNHLDSGIYLMQNAIVHTGFLVYLVAVFIR